jgi:hypothetical protein
VIVRICCDTKVFAAPKYCASRSCHMSPAVHPQVSSIVRGVDWSAAGDMTVVVESGAATVSAETSYSQRLE